MATHAPLVIERADWRITKAQCSCGAALELGIDSKTVKGQTEKLRQAFQNHTKLLRLQAAEKR